MKWKGASLRKRLMLWLLLPLGLLSLANLLEARSNARDLANSVSDRVLLSSALAIAERVVLIGDQIEVDVPYIALEMLTSAADDRVFYKVSNAQGDFITGYRDLPTHPMSEPVIGEDPLFFDATYNGETVRIATLSRYAASSRMATRYQVMIAETTTGRDELANEIFTKALIRHVALITLAALIVWFGVGQGLKPLTRLEAALHRRSSTDLRPILHEVPQEVRHLVDAINHLLQRLEDAFSTMQRFTADAAHQLRTPLAALKTQAELALRETDPDAREETLRRLNESCWQTTRLATQLLSLAKAAPEGQTGYQFQDVDLGNLCRFVATRKVPEAMNRGLDLGVVTPEDHPAMVSGDPTMLEEALKNLLHNALGYCPAGSHITASVVTDPSHVTLIVEDNGPGIPEEHRERVFERFFRGNARGGTEGCGLGLAIVKEIAERHHAVISLTPGADNRGTKISLCFPAA